MGQKEVVVKNDARSRDTPPSRCWPRQRQTTTVVLMDGLQTSCPAPAQHRWWWHNARRRVWRQGRPFQGGLENESEPGAVGEWIKSAQMSAQLALLFLPASFACSLCLLSWPLSFLGHDMNLTGFHGSHPPPPQPIALELKLNLNPGF